MCEMRPSRRNPSGRGSAGAPHGSGLLVWNHQTAFAGTRTVHPAEPPSRPRCKTTEDPYWKRGIGLGAAREKVRVAHALKDLPRITDEFRQGRISFSKVRAMTRIATPENEEYLMMIARHGTASHVEHLVRQFRKVKRIEALEHENRRHMLRELNWHIDDHGSYLIRARLTPEQGERVVKALEAACDENDSEVGASEQLCAGATVPLRDALVCFGERGLVVPNKRAKTRQRARKGPSRRVSPEKPHLARCGPRS